MIEPGLVAGIDHRRRDDANGEEVSTPHVGRHDGVVVRLDRFPRAGECRAMPAEFTSTSNVPNGASLPRPSRFDVGDVHDQWLSGVAGSFHRLCNRVAKPLLAACGHHDMRAGFGEGDGGA